MDFKVQKSKIKNGKMEDISKIKNQKWETAVFKVQKSKIETVEISKFKYSKMLVFPKNRKFKNGKPGFQQIKNSIIEKFKN